MQKTEVSLIKWELSNMKKGEVNSKGYCAVDCTDDAEMIAFGVRPKHITPCDFKHTAEEKRVLRLLREKNGPKGVVLSADETHVRVKCHFINEKHSNRFKTTHTAIIPKFDLRRYLTSLNKKQPIGILYFNNQKQETRLWVS